MAPFSSRFKEILSYPILQNYLKTLLFFILTKILLYPIMWTSPHFTSYTPIFLPPFTSYTPISYYLLHLTHLFPTTFYILHTYTLPPCTKNFRILFKSYPDPKSPKSCSNHVSNGPLISGSLLWADRHFFPCNNPMLLAPYSRFEIS